MRLTKSQEIKWTFASDLHGDNQDFEASHAFLHFVDVFKPDVRVFGGDLFDFRAIRRGANKEEKADSMALDIELGLKFLDRYKPDVFLRGNHDERLWQLAQNGEGLLRDHAQEGVRSIETKCKIKGIKMLPYNASEGIYDLGNLRFIHGYHAGIYATKKHAEIYAPSGGAVLHGHTHQIQSTNIPRSNGARGYAVGCLARTAMEYNYHRTSRLTHQNGWAYGIAWKGGSEVMQARRSGRKWLYATDIKAHEVV